MDIVINSALKTRDLMCLFSNKILAIHIPKYISPELSGRLANYALASSELECYHHEIKDKEGITFLDYGVDRLGVSFNTTYGEKATVKDRYYNAATVNIKKRRTHFSEQLLAFDKFRLELDEAWNYKVGLACFEGRKNTAGIMRVMRRPKDIGYICKQPHVDILPAQYANLSSQFTANIYLQQADNGGNLEIWDVAPLSMEDEKKVQTDFDWRGHLPKPKLLKPEAGDLILFNSRCPHSITSFTQGERVSIQSFIGLEHDNSIILWS